jgi:phytoene synthase
MTPDQYCAQRTASSGSSFYYSFLFLPDERRKAITALYAFCREVDDAVDDCSDATVARAKLAWWREEIRHMYEGTPQHPVTRALRRYIAACGLQEQHFHEIIAGMEMDLDQTVYPDFEALRLYCHRVAGVVGLLAAHIFGFEEDATLDYAEHLGLAFQLTNIIRDVREDTARGRVYLPQDEMQRFGVGAAQLHGAETPDALKDLLRALAQRAHWHYERALEVLPAADRYRQRCGLIMAEVYRETLHAIERDGFHVLERRARLPASRKFWIAWSTARREKRRHLDSPESTPAA